MYTMTSLIKNAPPNALRQNHIPGKSIELATQTAPVSMEPNITN